MRAQEFIFESIDQPTDEEWDKIDDMYDKIMTKFSGKFVSARKYAQQKENEATDEVSKKLWHWLMVEITNKASRTPSDTDLKYDTSIDSDGKIVEPTIVDTEEMVAKIGNVAQKVFNKKYPGVKVYSYLESMDGIEICTLEGGFENLQNIPRADDDGIGHYSLMIMPSFDGDELRIFINWGYAGQFTGVTANIIQAVFNLCEKEWGEANSRVIDIPDDASDGIWKNMASKMGWEYKGKQAVQFQ